MPQSEGYGARFVAAWRKEGLSDIEAWDLEDLEKYAQAETLSFLRKQPGLGTARALDHAEEEEPEALASALARERAAAKEAEVPLAEQSWGRALPACLPGPRRQLQRVLLRRDADPQGGDLG